MKGSALPPTSHVATTGTLRAVINLGNPVLAQGTAAEPRGVTVAIARELARWLAVPLHLECVDAARKSYAAMTENRVDLCFLANEPVRKEGVAFTAPYVVIDGVYVTDLDAPFQTSDEVDRDGVRIGVRNGSAYDLFLSRSLKHADLVRADEAPTSTNSKGSRSRPECDSRWRSTPNPQDAGSSNRPSCRSIKLSACREIWIPTRLRQFRPMLRN